MSIVIGPRRAVEHASTSTLPSDTTQWVIPALILIALVTIATVAIVAVVLIERSRVIGASVAVRDLDELNGRVRPYLVKPPRIRRRFTRSATSKPQYDRLDLTEYLTTSVMELEAWFDEQLAPGIRVLETYARYCLERQVIGDDLLGRSAHPKLRPERFAKVERAVFDRRTIHRPAPRATIVARLTYTSPKGRNSYSRSVTWGFDELTRGMAAAREARVRQSDVRYRRQRERALMTLAMRTDILRRDGYRCRMCGASSSDGIALHVDHIVPVSLDGRTVAENLQTLCDACNLGKSNRFVG